MFAVGTVSPRTGMRLRAAVVPVRSADGVVVGRAVLHAEGIAVYLEPGVPATNLLIGRTRIE